MAKGEQLRICSGS